MIKNKLIRRLKQSAAGLLAGAMVLTGVPLGNITSQAAGLLPNTDLQVIPGSSNKYISNVSGFSYGSSDSTAFVFGPSSGHQGTNSGAGDTFTFKFAGVTEASTRGNNTRGYYDNAQAATLAGTAANAPTIR